METAASYRKGICLTKLGRYREAAECFEKTIRKEKKEKFDPEEE